MIFNLIIILIISNISFSSSFEFLDNSKDWVKLKERDGIEVSTIEYENMPYCKATKIYPYSSDKIKKILDDKASYPTTFERIESLDSLSADIVHIKINLPFPFSGRDYIVRYKYFQEKKIEYYEYSATKDIQVNLEDGYVRLHNAFGIWKIEPIDNNSTKLTHIWNGQLLGNFPSWALSRAWVAQGNELSSSISNQLISLN